MRCGILDAGYWMLGQQNSHCKKSIMPLLIQYLIKLSISLAVVWLFYQLVLRRLTFYNWNRWFLLGYSFIAFFIPLIDISPALEQSELVNHEVVQLIPVVDRITATADAVSFNTWDWTFMLFAAGSTILLIRLIVQHISFLRLRRSSDLILQNPVKVYQVNDKIIPFSFGNAIFINQMQHSREDLLEIIKHEFVHVRQKHSIDMLCAEWLCILNWFNPFAWLIRSAIRQNLEFIADSKVVQNGIDKKEYQHLLLKVIGVPQYSIATNFNFSSLKKRIVMINKMKSAKMHLMKFLFVFPLMCVMLVAFRNGPSSSENLPAIATGTKQSDTVPVHSAKPAKAAIPKNISRIAVVDNEATITLKNGTTEKYNLSKPEEKAAFEKKYGTLPEPPEPPAPSTPANHSVAAPHPAPLPVVAPAPPPPPAAPVVSKLPSNVSNIHIKDEKAIVRLKNGKVETYDLSKPAEKDTFEKKYGDVKPPPPPVAPAAPDTVFGIASQVIIQVAEPVAAASGVPVASFSGASIEVQPPTHSRSPIDKEEIIIEIPKQITIEKIEELRKELLLKGYSISLRNTNFQNSFLQSVEGVIADEESRSSFKVQDFSNISISRVTYKNGQSRFYIRVSNGIMIM